MIYINKRLHARQVAIDSSDLTAVFIKHQHDAFLFISVYVQGQQTVAQNRTSLHQSLHLIRQVIQQVRTRHPLVHLVIAGDFNRHHELWGGEFTRQHRSHEGEPIIDLISEFQLWSALPQGTPTFLSWGTTQQTTIELMLIFNQPPTPDPGVQNTRG